MRCNAPDAVEHFEHRGAMSHHGCELGVFEKLVFQLQATLSLMQFQQQRFHPLLELLHVNRFGQVISGAFLDRFHGRFRAVLSGE